MRSRYLVPVLLWLALASGCSRVTARQVDKEVQLIAHRVGVEPARTEGQLPPPPTLREAKLPTQRIDATPTTERAPIRLASLGQPEQPKTPPTRLVIPAELPGADAPPIKLPRDKDQRSRLLKELYPPMRPPPKLPQPAPGPEGRPLTLRDLQRLAEDYSPNIKNAFAAVQAARGAAFDVGQYPNPIIAFEHDTSETGPAGYPGFYIDQVIKTGGKLTVAQAAATMDILNAQVALRKARSDVRYAVRGNYFAVLVAQENIRVNEALYQFTEQVYRVQLDLVEAGVGAAYEPMQLRPLVLQAGLNLIQAQNQYTAVWRQLATNLGLPDMPPTEVEGRVDMPVPVFEYEQILARLRNHTDVLTAQVSIEKAKFNLRLQKLLPLPDVELRLLVQKDYSTPPNQVAHTAVLSAQVPLWDLNKGGIRQYEWLLAQASLGPDQARNALINTLADAFNRYLTARRSVDIVGQQIRDQVRVYRGVYERRQQAPDEVSFGDVVTAEQTLSGYISGYITALGLQWQAVVDVANLLQTEDLFQAGQQLQEVVPLPDLKNLLPPPPPNVPEDHPIAALLLTPRDAKCRQGSNGSGTAIATSVASGSPSAFHEPGAGELPALSAAPADSAIGPRGHSRQSGP
jgi:cobalt-zinc-cadmium efflux system outer membrane protein